MIYGLATSGPSTKLAKCVKPSTYGPADSHMTKTCVTPAVIYTVSYFHSRHDIDKQHKSYY